MTKREIKDSDNNTVLTLIEAENVLEDEVLKLTTQLGFHFEQLRNPDSVKDFKGYVRVGIKEGTEEPTIIFIAQEPENGAVNA
jgi:hypothetical protein